MDEVSFPYHEHPLHRSGGFGLLCAGCVKVAYSSDGYRCSECYGHRFFLHKECAESPLQITLSSHPQHPLHFIGTYHDHEKTCHLCGDYISEVSYHCFTCHIYVHIGCARDPPMPVIKNPMDHRGFLTLVTQIMGFTCDVCGGESHSYCYMCHHCYFFCHIGCISLYPEITHPSHPHPLRFLENGEPHYSDGKCGLCGEEFENGRLYHCSACNYSLDLTCVKYPPPLSYVSPKTHEHELTLLPGNMSFTCDACGEYGYRSPYACHQCDIKFHQTCFDLPLLINNNRHDHPIHRTYLFDRGLDLFCGVCHGKLDGPSEAYVCVSCDNFAVHSICATGFRVWDGRELKGKPDEMEDTEPFRVVNGNLINHFSHEEHELRLKNDGNVCQDNIHCRACVRPIDTDPFYSCTQCDFVLHETCANLPRTKRHPLSTTKLTLTSSENFPEGSFTCDACKRHSSGFGVLPTGS
ncbi:PREDICTED: uncharacterized protein LOC104799077 isoform X2 [Tarenaya hassleriana]|uniref:uncharacterized protein LOC104799077 isoform X2 n=1 Tax=Tarenaya hassleriana TaxID=28532 RepID=UPI00053C0DD3|nr:PREDICTED: uncharacterized protein LOC104799077 isoform X2 [Tarenaya hassleriana]